MAFFCGILLTTPREARLSLIARIGAPGSGTTRLAGVHGPRGQKPVDDLVAVHADAVYRYALRLTRNQQQAEDLTQETLLRGWQRQRTLREPTAARVWLLRIATNLHRDGFRALRLTAPYPAAEAKSPRAAVETRLEQQECVALALAALDELPPRQRQAMHLVTIEQLTHQDAAAVLEITVEALKSSLSLARKAMREKLKDIYDDIRGARTS